MSSWKLTMLLISGFCARFIHGLAFPDYMATQPYFQHMDGLEDLPNISGAGAQRGPSWYDYDTSVSDDTSVLAEYTESSSLEGSSAKETESKSSGASSIDTGEKQLATRTYRECTPCPIDMIKKHTNIGIKWICGMYQRAQRSFKSECMMRFRNCQDGTMFVKIGENRCLDDAYHGRHWFYVYRV